MFLSQTNFSLHYSDKINAYNRKIVLVIFSPTLFIVEPNKNDQASLLDHFLYLKFFFRQSLLNKVHFFAFFYKYVIFFDCVYLPFWFVYFIFIYIVLQLWYTFSFPYYFHHYLVQLDLTLLS